MAFCHLQCVSPPPVALRNRQESVTHSILQMEKQRPMGPGSGFLCCAQQQAECATGKDAWGFPESLGPSTSAGSSLYLATLALARTCIYVLGPPLLSLPPGSTLVSPACQGLSSLTPPSMPSSAAPRQGCLLISVSQTPAH